MKLCEFLAAEECISLNGNLPEFASNTPPANDAYRSQDHILAVGLAFTCSGNVTNWQAYVEESRTYDPVIFQVWHPLADGCTYELRDSHTLESYQVGNDLLIDTATLDSPLVPISVEPGDVVGVYADADGRGSGSVGFQQYPSDTSSVFVDRVNSRRVERISSIDSCDMDSIMGAPVVNPIVSGIMV